MQQPSRADADPRPIARQRIPTWMKWLYTAFAAAVAPVYARQYGWRNFLWFSDVALFATVPALWLEHPLLSSMQTVSLTVPEAGWAIDFAAHLFAGRRPIGLADYMFDPKIRRSIRAISLFHLWLPPLLMWTVSRLGYDRRALPAQTLATWALLVTTYHVTEPGDDINWVYGLSGSPQHRINPTIYLLLVMAVYPIAFHWPAHVAFTRIFPAPSDINRPCSSATTTGDRIRQRS